MLTWFQNPTAKNRLEAPLLRRSRLLLPAAVFVAMAWAGFGQPASATVMTTTLDFSFGAGGADGSSFDVILDDGDTPGTVKLTFDLTNLTNDFTGTKVTSIYLSYIGAPLLLTSFGAWSGDTPSISICATSPCGDVSFKADGDGLFDLLFEFPTSGNLFAPLEMTMATITLAGITVADFIGLSNTEPPAGDKGPFCMASHVQSGLEGNSDFLGAAQCISIPETEVPEPASLLLFGIGLLGLGALGRRRRVA